MKRYIGFFVLSLAVVFIFSLFIVCENIVCEKTCKHTGGTATCIYKAVCGKCGQHYGELSAIHAGGTATCVEKAICEERDEYYGELSSHNFEGQ